MFVAQVINKQVSKNINTTLLPNYGTVNKGDRCKLCMNVLLHTFRNRMKQNGAGSDWCTVPTGFVLFTLRHQSPDQMQNESKCQTSTSALYNSLVVMGLLNWPNQETISKCTIKMSWAWFQSCHPSCWWHHSYSHPREGRGYMFGSDDNICYLFHRSNLPQQMAVQSPEIGKCLFHMHGHTQIICGFIIILQLHMCFLGELPCVSLTPYT